MNTPVKRPIAKLLKEKGFEQNPMKHISEATMEGTLVFPTISEVVMWLYEKHDIWINVNWNVESGDIIKNGIKYYFYYFNDIEGNRFQTPTEAYEAAIQYVLNNLI